MQQASHRSAVAAAVFAMGGVHLFAEETLAKLRLGIIGCGGIMTTHVKGLVDRREAASMHGSAMSIQLKSIEWTNG